MGRNQYLDQNNQLIALHSIILTVKLGSVFSIFSLKILEASKTYPALIGSGCKYVRCFPCYLQVYCNTTSCPYPDFGKVLQVQFKIHGTQDIMMIFSFAAPFKSGIFRCLIGSIMEGGRKFSKMDS